MIPFENFEQIKVEELSSTERSQLEKTMKRIVDPRKDTNGARMYSVFIDDLFAPRASASNSKGGYDSIYAMFNKVADYLERKDNDKG